MLSTGSITFLTPKRSAVSGISCISPWAFLGDTASLSKPDSARMKARTRTGSILYLRPIRVASRAIWRGAISGRATRSGAGAGGGAAASPVPGAAPAPPGGRRAAGGDEEQAEMIGGRGMAVAGGGAIELARLVEVARHAVAGLKAQALGEIL